MSSRNERTVGRNAFEAPRLNRFERKLESQRALPPRESATTKFNSVCDPASTTGTRLTPRYTHSTFAATDSNLNTSHRQQFVDKFTSRKQDVKDKFRDLKRNLKSFKNETINNIKGLSNYARRLRRP